MFNLSIYLFYSLILQYFCRSKRLNFALSFPKQTILFCNQCKQQKTRNEVTTVSTRKMFNTEFLLQLKEGKKKKKPTSNFSKYKRKLKPLSWFCNLLSSKTRGSGWTRQSSSPPNPISSIFRNKTEIKVWKKARGLEGSDMLYTIKSRGRKFERYIERMVLKEELTWKRGNGLPLYWSLLERNNRAGQAGYPALFPSLLDANRYLFFFSS